MDWLTRSSLATRLRSPWPPAIMAIILPLILFGSTEVDDAYITFGAARSLAEHGAIWNYNGHPLEQSSSILHVAVLAALRVLTKASIPWIALVVGLLGAFATVAATHRLGREVLERHWVFAAWCTATAVPLTYWAVGGLETTMAAASLTCAVAAFVGLLRVGISRMRLAAAYGAVGAYVALRPEGVFVALAAVASLVVLWKIGPRRWNSRDDDTAAPPMRLVAHAVTAIAVPSAALLVLRRLVFDAWVPHPVSAKAHGIDLQRGVLYSLTTLDRVSTLVLGVLALLAMVAVVRAVRTTNVALALVSSVTIAQMSMVLITGGDWMRGGRFLCTVFPLIAVLAADTLSRLAPRRDALLATLLICLNLLGLEAFRRSDSEGTSFGRATSVPDGSQTPDGFPEAMSRGVRRDLAALPALTQTVRRLYDALAEPVTVASGQAGVSIYYLTSNSDFEVRFIDRYGLTDDSFAACDGLLKRSVYGAVINYDVWFEHETDCAVPKPDVIFELGRFGDIPAIADEYTLVFQQVGEVETDESHPSASVSLTQFVAVRNDLVPRLHD